MIELVKNSRGVFWIQELVERPHEHYNKDTQAQKK